MTRWIALICLLASAAAAEGPSRVTGRLDGKMARLSVRYDFLLGANQWERGTLLALPTGAQVTGAVVTQDGVAHRLDLVDAKVASAKFAALPARRDGGGKVSAVMMEVASGGVSVATASPRDAKLVVELEVTMPTCYHGDTRYAMVPNSWWDVAGRALQRESAGTCPKTSEDGGEWLGFASKSERIAASADRVDLGDESLVRVEVGTASLLSEIPRDLATVLIVDGSRSLSDDERAMQRALVASYLQKAPTSQVQIISFARTAQSLLPAWSTASRAKVDAALAALVPRNGSNFDLALAEAATWLARTGGTKRVVLVTDEKMASRLAHASLEGILPAGVLLHVVVPSWGDELRRDDELKLASMAARTEGFAVRLGSVEVDATPLLRPISLDHVKVVAHGWEHLDSLRACADDMALGEGTGCTWWGRGNAGTIAIEGALWGKRISRTLTPDLARSRDVAREASTLLLGDDLRTLAEAYARAVNHKWSLYTTWGGTSGYDGMQSGAGGWGVTCGCDAPGTIGHGNGTGSGTGPAPPSIQSQLEPAIRACTLGDAPVTVAIEMTDHEIADVHVSGATDERCVLEAVWASSPVIDVPHAYRLVSFVVGH